MSRVFITLSFIIGSIIDLYYVIFPKFLPKYAYRRLFIRIIHFQRLFTLNVIFDADTDLLRLQICTHLTVLQCVLKQSLGLRPKVLRYCF